MAMSFNPERMVRGEKVLAWGLTRHSVPAGRWCWVEQGCTMTVRAGFSVDGLLVVDGVLMVSGGKFEEVTA
jgi:hypothetical protein